jgi:hypothetical protein
MELTDLKVGKRAPKGRVALVAQGSEFEVGQIDIERMDVEAGQPEKPPEKKRRP